jgi:hypothetical protein
VGRGTVLSDGAADSRSGLSAAHVGRPEKETEWLSPDEQYGFGFI